MLTNINLQKMGQISELLTVVFLCILIFFLPISKAAVQIFVSLTILALIGSLAFNKLNNFPKTELNFPLLAFFISLCLSVLFSTDFKSSLITLLKKNIEWFLLFFAVVTSLNSKKRITVFLWVLFFSSLLVCSDGIFQQVIGKDFLRRRFFEYKMTASFEHYNDFAGYIEVLLPFSLSCLLASGEKYKFFFGFLTFFLSYCFIMTMSRMGFVAVFIGMIFYILYVFSNFKMINFKKIVIILLILCLVFSVFIFIAFKMLPYHWLSERSTITGSGRLGIWKDSLIFLKTRPIFGVGIGNFMQQFKKMNPNINPTYAHNCYLQIMEEAGIVGLLSFLSVLIIFFMKTLKAAKKNNDILLLGILTGILIFLIHASFDTHFYSMQLSDFFWLMFGLAFAIAKVGPIEV